MYVLVGIIILILETVHGEMTHCFVGNIIISKHPKNKIYININYIFRYIFIIKIILTYNS